MKKMLVTLVMGTLLAGPMVGEAKAGDREWAVAGKVLAGLLVLDAIAEPCHRTPVVYAPPVYHRPVVVYRPPVVYHQPVVVYRPPVVYHQPVVVYRPPVVYRRPIVYHRPVCRPIVVPRRPTRHPHVPGRPVYHTTYRDSNHGGRWR